jgi:hypothetical protein
MKKNEYDAWGLETFELYDKDIIRPSKSRETVPLTPLLILCCTPSGVTGVENKTSESEHKTVDQVLLYTKPKRFFYNYNKRFVKIEM